MIDLHCHFLPGIDDGPDTLDEALALARAGRGRRHHPLGAYLACGPRAL
jgi:protein-tyrosine phosphatase